MGPAGTFAYFTNIYDLAIIFKKSINLNDTIYVPFQGRIYNSTWNHGKTSASLIESPLDMLEHVNRLQNWSEVNAAPTGGWGTAYADNAKIKLSGTGSFDSTDTHINPLRDDFKAACGIYDYKKAYTDEIKKRLCYEFDMISWVDKDGYECVDRYLPSLTAPTETIDMTKIPMTDRKNISITLPAPTDIYCQPFVRYNKNPGDGTFQSVISITSVSADVYSASYVTGIDTPADALNLWTACHRLWLKCRMITEPPTDMTDLEFANGAGGYAIAYEKISNWIAGMAYPRITLPAHYNDVGAWEEGHRFYIQLPHQTNNVIVECQLESITVNPVTLKCTLDAVMYATGDVPEEFDIQKVFTTLADADMWQKTHATETGENNIQKVV
jgi:hypothetical protein